MAKPYKVLLASLGNSDFGQDSSRPLRGAVKRWKPVDSIEEAQEACAEYIQDHDLGSGNWCGGEIRNAAGNEVVGSVSYNGKFWPSQPEEVEVPTGPKM